MLPTGVARRVGRAPQRRAGPGGPARSARRGRAGVSGVGASTKGWPRRASESQVWSLPLWLWRQPQRRAGPGGPASRASIRRGVGGGLARLNEGLAPEGQRAHQRPAGQLHPPPASTKGWPRRASEARRAAGRLVVSVRPQRRAGPGGPARALERVRPEQGGDAASTKGWPRRASESSRRKARPCSCSIGLNEGLAPEGQRGGASEATKSASSLPQRRAGPGGPASRLVSASWRLMSHRPQRRAGPGGPARRRRAAGRRTTAGLNEGLAPEGQRVEMPVLRRLIATSPQRRAGPGGPASCESSTPRAAARRCLNEGLAPEGQRAGGPRQRLGVDEAASTKGWPRRASEATGVRSCSRPRCRRLNEGLAPEGQRGGRR